jgi:hypothetical protein
MASRFYRVRVEEIGFVRAIVEAYEGVAVIHAPDPRRGEIEWVIGDGLEAEADEIAARLSSSIGLVPIERPSDWPSE